MPLSIAIVGLPNGSKHRVQHPVRRFRARRQRSLRRRCRPRVWKALRSTNLEPAVSASESRRVAPTQWRSMIWISCSYAVG